MSNFDNTINGDGCELDSFERNRYFNGKLMTARDMAAEQAYHADRLNTLARTVAGEGIVCGLEVTRLTETDGQLEVDINPGVAIDCCGREVIVDEGVGSVPVRNAETGQTEPPGGDHVYLYLRYDDCVKQTVPALGAEEANGEDCEYNRVLETFEVVYVEVEETPTDTDPRTSKPVPDVAFPSAADLEDDETDALFRMARSFYEVGDGNKGDEGPERDDGELKPCPDCEEPAVYLGAFDESEGAWRKRRGTDRPDRPFVYTNDFLHAAMSRHVTDFDNPHEVHMAVEELGGGDTLLRNERHVTPGTSPPHKGDVKFTSPESTLDIAAVTGDDAGEISIDIGDDEQEILGKVDPHIADFEDHLADTDNPHEVDAADVGLDDIVEADGETLGAVFELATGDGVDLSVDSGTITFTATGSGMRGEDNTASGENATVAGGESNTASGDWSAIGGGQNNTASGENATVGGGHDNAAEGPGATIAGGEANTASGDEAVVGGGDSNKASGDYSFLGNGEVNTVTGAYAFVGSGYDISATGRNAAVVGGEANEASGDHAVTGGGAGNVASADGATVPGGDGNVADGPYSVAAGRNANADGKAGAFVVGDSTDDEVTAGAADEVRFQAGGGFVVQDGDLSVEKVGLSAYLSLNQSIPADSTETVVFDEVNRDDFGGYDASTGVYTVEADGDYHLSFVVDWQDQFSSTTVYYKIVINGSPLVDFDRTVDGKEAQSIDRTLFDLSSGDTVEVQVDQQSDDSKNIFGTGAREDTFLTLRKVG